MDRERPTTHRMDAPTYTRHARTRIARALWAFMRMRAQNAHAMNDAATAFARVDDCANTKNAGSMNTIGCSRARVHGHTRQQA
eukprot:13216917-Alexandrium_andersonii.AAC.1